MIDLTKVAYNATSEKLVEILSSRTQNPSKLFFRIQVAYFFSKITSMMRINIDTKDRGKLPVNMYAINLAPSGQGKGHSTNIIEEQIIHEFRERFLSETFPQMAEINLPKLALKRAYKKQCDEAEELIRVQKEFEALGQLAFSFDSGTPAAVKQMRHKLLMADAGSMNMEIDEIGSNLLGNVDVLNAFLELFDIGKIKQKLTKNTNENIRSEEIDGRTPTNMMLFGTPAKLLNGGKAEEEFYAMLETGYARRCFFGYLGKTAKPKKLTALERYNNLTNTQSETYLGELATKLGLLADPVNFGIDLVISKDVSLKCIEYQISCEERAEKLSDHEEIKKAELTHRYFKALKLAGVYAFIESSFEITEDHLYSAIKLVEESGEAFNMLLTRDRNYVKLAKYVANMDREVTHADLTEDLGFYRGSESAKNEMLKLAIAWGYKNNVIVKKSYNDGIEFLQGETLKETNINELTIAYSQDLAFNYMNDVSSFDDLHILTQQPGFHWTSHHILNGGDTPPAGHRKEDNMLAGFNIIVIDVDEGVSLSTAKLLLSDYKYHIHTTKRHQTEGHGDRFRILMPMSHTLRMDSNEYKEFMNNVYEWLPFKCDMETAQRSRKWMSHKGQYWNNDGQIMDSLLFIPKTSKSEENKKIIASQQSLSNVERWFVNNTGTGNRSNQLIKFALMLVDSGKAFEDVKNNVLALNSKLADKMDEAEILGTIMQTAGKAIYKRDA